MENWALMVRSDVDGSVVTWGDREWGGDSSKVQRQLVKGAVQAGLLVQTPACS